MRSLHAPGVAFVLFAIAVAGTTQLESQIPPEVTRLRLTPPVVPVHQTTPVLLEATVSGNPSSVVFGNGGPEQAMRNDGAGGDRTADDDVWTIQVPASDIVTRLTPEWVHRPFVGYCRPAGGGFANVFADIWTPAMGLADVQPVDGSTQRTRYVVNVVAPRSQLDARDYPSWARRFYTYYADDFDFLNFVYIAGLLGNTHHLSVSNNVRGIGLPLFDGSSQYGSRGRLKGLNVWLRSNLFDGASFTFNHEVGHTWINHLPSPQVAGARPHWPKGNLGGNVMGIPLEQGARYPFVFTPTGAGGYVVESATPEMTQTFNAMELYLMGLVPPAQVGPFFVLIDQTLTVTAGQVLQPAEVTHVTVDDVVAISGPREPASTVSQKAFSSATIVLSDLPLDQYALSFYDWFAQRAEGTTPVSCTGNFTRSTCQPFYRATGGRASMRTKIPLPFTDDPLVSGVSAIRALHIAELRSRVDGARARRGLAAYAYSTAPPIPGTTILGRHILELRWALAEVYAAAGMTPPVYTDETLAGIAVRARHISELRSAVIVVE